MVSSKRLKSRVSEVYAEKIRGVSSCCDDASSDVIYPADVLEGLPEGVASFGCGNPVALASLRPGQVVLDLGSGAGLDCFLASKAVGPTGRVIGVDFTPAMLEQARRNQAKLGIDNVSFRQGDIEALPLRRERGRGDIQLCDKPGSGQGRGVPRGFSGASTGRTVDGLRYSIGEIGDTGRNGRFGVVCGLHLRLFAGRGVSGEDSRRGLRKWDTRWRLR